MDSVLKFLFPSVPGPMLVSGLLLAARVLFGILLLRHGLDKWQHFDTLAVSFPDPLGVGSRLSLFGALFAEVVCSVGFITGALYRLALIPMIFTMGVALFVIHRHDPFAVKEPALLYLALFLLMYVAGPGRFAVDRLIACRLLS